MYGFSLDIPTPDGGMPAIDRVMRLAERLWNCGSEIFMPKPRFDQITDETIAIASRIQKTFGIPIFFHPFERDSLGNWHIANDAVHMKLMVKTYKRLFEAIRDNGFYPLFVFHGGRLEAEGTLINGKERVTVEEAMEGTADFIRALQDAKADVFRKTRGDIALAIENMPKENKGEYPLCYSLRQMKRLRSVCARNELPNKVFWNLFFVLDLGHLQLTNDTIDIYQSVVDNSKCVHISGNRLKAKKKDDSHLKAVREHLRNPQEIEFFLAHPDMKHVAKIFENTENQLSQISDRGLRYMVNSYKRGVIPCAANVR